MPQIAKYKIIYALTSVGKKNPSNWQSTIAHNFATFLMYNYGSAKYVEETHTCWRGDYLTEAAVKLRAEEWWRDSLSMNWDSFLFWCRNEVGVMSRTKLKW